MADTDLYIRHRPSSFEEVVGQHAAVNQLEKMHAAGKIPHVLLFTGPSGTGKTTLARIVKSTLDCSDMDFVEINAARERGIDMVRELSSQCRAMPVAGKSRVFLLDECHALSSDAQSALLKVLEDTPKHVYFMLATTDPQKLKQTIRTRATQIKCVSLKNAEVASLVKAVIKAEGLTNVTGAAAKKLVQVSQGSARQALVILNQIAELPDEESQIEAIEASDWEADAIQIARLLFRKGTRWKEVADVISNLSKDENFEGLRRMILSYATSVILKPGGQDAQQRAADILDEFRDNYFDTGKAGLVLNCWNAVNR